MIIRLFPKSLLNIFIFLIVSELLPLRLLAAEIPPINTNARLSPFQRTFSYADANTSTTCMTSLSPYPLDKLKFVGAVILASHCWGLISLPDASIVSVQKGDVIGRYCGEIVDIDMQKLLIKEKVLKAGKWEETLTTLVLEARNREDL